MDKIDTNNSAENLRANSSNLLPALPYAENALEPVLSSGFIQNIGAAALFLPGILNISRREKIPASALIMPIGFVLIRMDQDSSRTLAKLINTGKSYKKWRTILWNS